MIRMIAVGTALGLLAIAGVARAESAVPLNYLDDFGSPSQAFTLGDSAAPATPSTERERFAAVYSPNAPGSASSGAKLTVTAPPAARDRFAAVYAPNGPGTALPMESSTPEAKTEVARSH